MSDSTTPRHAAETIRRGFRDGHGESARLRCTRNQGKQDCLTFALARRVGKVG